ncbi:MAG: BNR repeat-containing protein, partial [Candidatus Eisenbacteria bacterium]|nr:BNR repeat-containing protein [Candidatus Eisenbacteria bacterium]
SFSSLALDSSGRPHIAYYDEKTQDLRYAFFDGLGWQFQTVESTGNAGTYPSLVLDETDLPHVSFSGTGTGTCPGLRYAFRQGDTWHLEWVDPPPS